MEGLCKTNEKTKTITLNEIFVADLEILKMGNCIVSNLQFWYFTNWEVKSQDWHIRIFFNSKSTICRLGYKLIVFHHCSGKFDFEMGP